MSKGCWTVPGKDLTGFETEWIRVVEPTKLAGKAGWYWVCECKLKGCRFTVFGKKLTKGKYKRCPFCKGNYPKKRPVPKIKSIKPLLLCQICGETRPRRQFRFTHLCRRCWAWRRRPGKVLVRLIARCYGCMNPNCQWFGPMDYAVIDFHHKDPTTKSFAVSNKDHTFEETVREIEKCICLCSNCHRLHHRGLLDVSNIPLCKVELHHLSKLIEEKCNVPDGSYPGEVETI
jgi:hypothetical protein